MSTSAGSARATPVRPVRRCAQEQLERPGHLSHPAVPLHVFTLDSWLLREVSVVAEPAPDVKWQKSGRGVIDRIPAVVQNKKASAFAKAFLYFSGAKGSRTLDPHNAIVVLYQLSYDPEMSRLRLPCEEVIKDMRNR